VDSAAPVESTSADGGEPSAPSSVPIDASAPRDAGGDVGVGTDAFAVGPNDAASPGVAEGPGDAEPLDAALTDAMSADGGPHPLPGDLEACDRPGDYRYTRDGLIPYVCDTGPANALAPSHLAWRRGQWYLMTRGQPLPANQTLFAPCAQAGEHCGFPGGTLLCTDEPTSHALRYASLVLDGPAPLVRWDPTLTYNIHACVPPSDAGNGSQFYRATLDIDPSDSNTLLLSIEWIGPFRSADGGRTWIPYNITGRALPARKPNGAACHGEYVGFHFDPARKGHVYFLAGGAPGSQVTTPVLEGGGIWATSDDAHYTWLGRPEMNQYVAAFARVSDTTLLWGTTSSLGTMLGTKAPTPMTKGLVYRSDDGGDTWTELPTGLWTESTASFLWVDRADHEHFRVGLFQYGQRLTPADVRAPGMLETTDGGKTFVPLAGLPAGDKSFTHDNTLISDDGAWIFSCGVLDADGMPACYRSVDGGASFAGPLPRLDVVALSRAPNSRRLVALRREGGTPTLPNPAAILLSEDGGATFLELGAPPAAGIEHLLWDPTLPDRVYATGEGGSVFRSDDAGRAWTRITTYTDFLDVPRTD
jgi:photosystem II stability/assembly factor-like uncharacterized protein